MNEEHSGSGRPPFIVGLGASAGGLQALERFFAAVPLDTQLAFIVVQHLSPNFETMMDDLLSRQTKLPIELVSEDTMVRPGHVYLLPPKKQMIVANGKLLVTDKPTGSDVFLPIDHLFVRWARTSENYPSASSCQGPGVMDLAGLNTFTGPVGSCLPRMKNRPVSMA